MVAHLWAHEQEESVSGSNFFFEGTSIYSYGYHFEVGRIVKNKQGKKAYLINEDYYSATTSKHQCYVRNAIPTWAMVFSVGDNISDTGNMRFVASKLESIKKSIEKYKRAKTELSYTDIWGAFGNMMVTFSSLTWELLRVSLKRVLMIGLEPIMNYPRAEIVSSVSTYMN